MRNETWRRRNDDGQPRSTWASTVPSTSSSNRCPQFRTADCKYWAKGSCRKGDACTYRHTSYASVATLGALGSTSRGNVTEEGGKRSGSRPSLVSAPPRPCGHFLVTGTCKFGDSCKFSHENPEDRTQATETRPEALLFTLKRMVKSFSRSFRFQLLRDFETYLDLALKLLGTKERNLRSEVVAVLSRNDLRDEDEFAMEGIDIIRHVVEQIGNPSPRSYLEYVKFEDHVLPFLKVILHDAFTQTVLEKNFRYVIKGVYGPDGERASRFLKRAITLLEDRAQSGDPEAIKEIVQEGCLLLCRLLLYIVRYNSDAVGQTELVEFHQKLEEISTSIRTPLSGRIDRQLREAEAYLIPVEIRTTEQLRNDGVSSVDLYEQYELVVDLPGELSRLTSRHDNDFDLISKVSILPTDDEVGCTRDPYLPINDISAPHFLDGPSRLFDTNFRLLREDMIGSLRMAVMTILQKLRRGDPISKQLSHRDRLHDPNIALTRLYFDVRVQSAWFSKKSGLIFRLGFRQPKQLEGLPPATRKNYWEATKSLDKGSLLCLISNAPGCQCFLTVTEKDPKLLVQDGGWCSIDVIPEGKGDKGQETLLSHIRRKQAPDSLALVEFPGVLLAAYKTILESLQARSKHPFLPFSDILCPKPPERQDYNPANPVLSVRPPLYALEHGFRFDLEPLKDKDASAEPLFLSPEASPDDPEILAQMEKQTTLDYGQCKGLVAGLTRELALIQGQYFFYFCSFRRSSRDRENLSWSRIGQGPSP